VRTVSKGFYVTAAAGIGVGGLCIGIFKASGDYPGDTLAFVSIGALALFLFGAIANMVLWYKMWAVIQDGSARTTPGTAIGQLLVPVYNLYWVFQAVWGFSKDYNRFLCRHGIKAEQLPEGVFLAFCILCVAANLPIVGVLFALINIVLLLVMTCKICDAINAVTGFQLQFPPPTYKKPTGVVSAGTVGLAIVGLSVLAALILGTFLGEDTKVIVSFTVILGGVGALFSLGGIVSNAGRRLGIIGLVVWLVILGIRLPILFGGR